MTMHVALVLPGALTETLAELLPYLRKSEVWSRGRSTVDDIVRFIVTGQMSLWKVFDDEDELVHGYIVGEIMAYPQGRWLRAQYCAMKPHILQLIEEKINVLAERYALDMGCKGIEFIGRPGWRKYAERHGYNIRSVMYQKLLGEVQ
jgi:hypothetical protein